MAPLKHSVLFVCEQGEGGGRGGEWGTCLTPPPPGACLSCLPPPRAVRACALPLPLPLPPVVSQEEQAVGREPVLGRAGLLHLAHEYLLQGRAQPPEQLRPLSHRARRAQGQVELAAQHTDRRHARHRVLPGKWARREERAAERKAAQRHGARAGCYYFTTANSKIVAPCGRCHRRVVHAQTEHSHTKPLAEGAVWQSSFTAALGWIALSASSALR